MGIRASIRNWLFNEENEKRLDAAAESINAEGMNFSIHSGSGGYVVETRLYDSVLGRTNHSLHIITTDEDFGQALAKIVTLEVMKQQ